MNNQLINIYKEKYGDDISINCHPKIRTEEACFKSSSLAIELAKKIQNKTSHISYFNSQGIIPFMNDLPIEKQITSEACIHHLWFEAIKIMIKRGLLLSGTHQ